MKIPLLFTLACLGYIYADYTPDDPTRFPRPLSPIASRIYTRVMEVALENPHKTPTPPALIGASGKLISHMVDWGDSREFGRRVFAPVILQAKEEVLVTTFIYNKDSPSAEEIRNAIIQLDSVQRKRNAGKPVNEWKRIRVWIAIDSLGATFYDHKAPPISGLFKSKSKIAPPFYNLPDPEDVPGLDLRVRAIHHGILGALHSKMIVVDGRLAAIGSKNMDGDTCMEYMYAVEGSVAMSLRADFQRIWAGDRRFRKAKMAALKANGVKVMDTDLVDVSMEEEDDEGDILEEELGDLMLPPVMDPITVPRPGDVPFLALGRVHGNHLYSKQSVNPQNVGWLMAMQYAEHEIYIQTPNFVAKEAADAVEAAVRRGITVTIVTSWSQQDMREGIQPNSVGSNRGTAKALFRRLEDTPAAAKRLRYCWFIGDRTKDYPEKHATKEEWSHVKAMFVDRRIGIVGSGNMDPQSWYHSREDNLLIDDKETVRSMLGMLISRQQSFKHCDSYGDEIED